MENDLSEQITKLIPELEIGMSMEMALKILLKEIIRLRIKAGEMEAE